MTVKGNRLISALSQAPKSVLDAAGLEPRFRGLLDRRFSRATAPDAPSRVAAFAGDGFALVTWSPPTFEGEAPVHTYTVTASNGPHVTLSAADFWSIGYVKVPDMENGTPYTFTVTATNINGTSVPSMPSLPETPGEKHLAVPAAPNNVHVLAGPEGIASVHFQAPPKAEAVTAYVFTVNPGNRKVTFTGRNAIALSGMHTTFTTIDGLTPGETYTITAAAVNPAGEGEASAPVSVTIPK